MMILFTVVGENIKIFYSKHKLKLLYIWVKNKGFILDLGLVEDLKEILERDGSYVMLRVEYSESSQVR